MNIELFKQNICTPLAELTERNDHSAAVVYLAERLNEIVKPQFAPANRYEQYAADLLKWAKYIQEEHNRLGEMFEPLLDFRNRIQHECLRMLNDYLPNDYIEALRASL